MDLNASTHRLHLVAVPMDRLMTNLSAETANASPDCGRAMVTTIAAITAMKVQIIVQHIRANLPSSGQLLLKIHL